MELKIETKDSKKEKKEDSNSDILTSSGKKYTKQMLLNRIEQIGLLDDYLSGKEVTSQSPQWVEFFSKEDILQIFASFPEVYERCKDLIEKKLGSSVLIIPSFDDTFCNLFEKVLKAAKAIHIKYSWAFGMDTEEFHHFEFAISLLNTYLEEDYRFSAKQKDRSILKGLDKFAESDFVSLQLHSRDISDQLHEIVQRGHCSAGFTEQLSRIYTALTLTRTIIYYQNLLAQKATKETEEKFGASPVVTWSYQLSALFFKPKKEIQQEMANPLYHGDIDTNTAKNILSSPGQYLARYSPIQKKHYLTILLDVNKMVGKIVLNLTIPEGKVKTWMKDPIENRQEIELFIKGMIMTIKESGTPLEQEAIIKFLTNEHYSPVLNQVSNTDMLNVSPKGA
ncbi:hypothetical protein [Legionella maioricensis]|uniref:SH2 domain-containing protein n=1 Tax=Legionella maioricensis TaxID=2896528 RepID=A0A9X2ICV4_9GAMM|nr:hypothetical protein [Legionella maioricensis]MCL9685596.1 hypothetical protein [Legionella maioricensis]MCL9689005.1 hypothetical protein [Legionella maioricensis]